MIFSHRRTDRNSTLLTLILFFSFLFTSGALAGYSTEDDRRTHKGGGSWGAILQMSVDVSGAAARFTVSKKDGLFFNTESNIAIRTGSYSGPAVATGFVQAGNGRVVLTVPLNGIAPSTQYYAYLSNSYGYAWAGPVQVMGYNDAASEVYQSDDEDTSYVGRGDRLGRPRIDGYSEKFLLNTQVRIPVTAGWCRTGRPVRVQCVAEDSNRTRNTPYESGWIRTGETVMVPFTFHSVGTKTISCATLDDCCSSSWVSRTIRIEKPVNRPPLPPRISSKPSAVKLGIPVHIEVLPGSDPNGDQVKIECRAEDARPFSSNLFDVPQWTDTVFTFDAPGSKTISCVTVDCKGAASQPTERLIHVRHAPAKSVGNRSTETKINISVVTGADGTSDSKVSVQNSRSEDCAPFCDGEISYDKPYLPDDGYSPVPDGYSQDNRYIMPEPVPDMP